MQTTEYNQDPNEIKIDFNINSELDFDDIDFKPLNEGLGFHNDKKEERVSLKSLQRTHEARTPVPQKKRRDYRKELKKTRLQDQTVNQDLLGSFYNVDTRPKQKEQKKSQSKKDFKFKMPTVYSQFGAFLVDLLVISTLTSLTVALFIFAAGLNPVVLMNNLSQMDMVTYLAPMFVIYFVAYFTLIETGQSIGKSLFKIETLDVSGKRPSLKQCFTRAIITLTSALALFLPLAMDFQDRLSETKLHQK